MDIERFRIDTDSVNVPVAQKTFPFMAAKRGEPFLRGPIPLPWLERAIAARGSSLPVGLCLWFMRGVAPGTPDIKVSRAVRKRLGVSPDQLRRGLLGLEAAGLLEFVNRGRGRCPVVRILPVTAPAPKPRKGEEPNG